MKKIYLLLIILFLPIFSHAQQTLNVKIDTCSYVPSTGTLTIDGVNVTSLSLSSLTLSGTQTYPDGTYLTVLANSVLTLQPYNPPIFLTAIIPASTTTIIPFDNTHVSFTIPAGITKVWIMNTQGAYVSNINYPWNFGVVIITPSTSTTTGAGILYVKNDSNTSYQFTGATVIMGIQ
jgi:hypothetical protein